MLGVQGEKGDQGFQGEKGDQGIQGEKGDSLQVVRRDVGTDAGLTVTGATATLSCEAGQTAIGAGYDDVAEGVTLVGSMPGTGATEWVLTFSAAPGDALTGTALCAATV